MCLRVRCRSPHPNMPNRSQPITILFALMMVLLAGAGCTRDLRKNRHLARGKSDFEAQRFDRAEIEYLKVLQAAPMNPAAVRQLALIYQLEGQAFRAHAYLLKAVELEPNNLEVHLKLSLSCLALRDLKRAREEARWVLARQPGQEEALEVLAESIANLREISSTRQELEGMLQAGKDGAGYHVAFGTLLLVGQDTTNAEPEFKKALELDAKSASAHFGLGNLYWIENDLPRAEQAFKTAADLSPARSPKRIRYAEFKLRSGAPAEARRILEDLTHQAPDYLPAWTFLARIALTERKYDEANGFLQRALARDPSNYEALSLNGEMELAKGEGAKAVAALNRLTAIYSKIPQVQYQLARGYLLSGDTAKAAVCLNQALALSPAFTEAVLLLANLDIRRGNVSHAIVSLKNVLNSQPQNPQAHLLLVNAYLAQKQPDQALEACSQMEQLFPKNPDIPLLMGSVLEGQNRKPEARIEFERSLKISPDYLPAIEQIVNLDIIEGNFAVGTDTVREQIQKHPAAGEPWILLAKIHFTQAQSYLQEQAKKADPSFKNKPSLGDIPAAQSDLAQAEAALLKAIELNPGAQTAYLMLANLYAASGRETKALENLNNVLARTNDLIALMQVGVIQDSLKNYPAARDAYQKLLGLKPNFTPAINNLAYLYSERLKDPKKAYQLGEKARQLQPYDPSIADTLGWILYKRGEYLRALGMLEESAAKLANDPEIQFHLGMTHYMLGEEQSALVSLQRAVQSPRDFPAKEEAAKRLAILSIDPANASTSMLAQLEQYLSETPHDPVALDRLGAIQERDGSFDKAIHSYQLALKYSPDNIQLLVQLARLYSSGRHQDFQQALAVAKHAHELAPDDPHVSAILGRLVFQTGDYKWSASLLENSGRELTTDPRVLFDLAWAYYSLGRVPEAVTAMQSAAQAGSPFADLAQARLFLVTVAAADNPAQADAMAQEIQKTLAADPDYVPALVVSALLEQTQGNFSRAASQYTRVLDRYPDFAPAIRKLALLCFEHLGDDKKAYVLASKARESFPRDADIARTLGILEFRKTNYSRAAQLLTQSLQTHRSDSELLYCLGMAQYHLKDKAESKAALEQALALKIKSTLADDAKRVLAELKQKGEQ